MCKTAKQRKAKKDKAKKDKARKKAGLRKPRTGAVKGADDSYVPLPDSLLATGIPPIPKTIAEAVGAYAEARSASVLDWHPREHSLLIATRFADTAKVHEVKQAGGARRQLTFFPDRVGAASYPPAGDGGFFVFSKDLGGNEFAQNWRLDRASGQVTLLTDGAAKNTLGPWSNGGWLGGDEVAAGDGAGGLQAHAGRLAGEVDGGRGDAGDAVEGALYGAGTVGAAHAGERQLEVEVVGGGAHRREDNAALPEGGAKVHAPRALACA